MAKTTKKTKTPQDAIPQTEIEKVYAQQAIVLDLKNKLKAAEKALEAVETPLFSKLQSGLPVAPGSYIASLQTTPGRVSVPWKSVAINAIVKSEGCTEMQAEANVKALHPAGTVTSLAISKLG